MPLSSLQDLERFLLEQQLVDSFALDECRLQLGRQLSFDSLLKLLEQRSLLTMYQAQKLKKQETDALRVGRYKLLYRNASGSFARVYRASAIDDGQTFAIKLLRQRYAEDPRSVSMFRREGELGKRLKHKNIVPIFEVASDGNQHYFAMEFVEGGNFRDFIKIRKKFAVPEATQYLLDIAEGLEYALRFRLTHRDLKLSNVLLSAQGVAKLVDFGLAGQDASVASAGDEVDRAIEYATLEKNTRAPDNDPRSDLYFLGAMYYELLTGVPPYPPTKNLDERRQFSRYRDIRDIREHDPNLPAEVVAIVDKLLAIDPADRYQSPTAVISDLRHALGQKHVASTGNASEDTAAPVEAMPPALICVENRPKQQDAMREYFSKHGYRVLVLTDPIRALNRMESEAVAGLLLVGDVLGNDIAAVFQAAVKRSQKRNTVVVLALSPKTAEVAAKLDVPSHASVLTEAITLRNIRQSIEQLRAATTTS